MICIATALMALSIDAKVFTVSNPDKKLSPYTGMTRDNWKQADEYLLSSAFQYVKDMDSPMELPKQEGKSYPRNDWEIPTARMEALCRTMFLAGPLLKENPSLILNGIPVGDYYRHQIAMFLDPKSPTYLPPHKGRGHGGQKLVELGGLSVSLLMAPEVFWTPLPQETRDSLAKVFTTYAEAGTIDMNWRFFNMCLLSFLDGQGYKVNKTYLEELLHKNLDAYVGDGWYHDAPLLDYYSMWAFQMYGPLWAASYGKTHYPKEAALFMERLADIPGHYPYMFGRDGKLQMWGRSITYRMGASIPLALTGLLAPEGKGKDIDYGWMRRICSGALMQFIGNKDFMAEDGLPNLGFYGHFEPCLQAYSCRGSVFWMAKLFLALYMPADNPFWTAVETEGPWSKMKAKQPHVLYSKPTKIMTVNYPALGMSEFRNVFTRNSGFYYGLENYNRFAYNSSLPWQADGEKDGEVAMCYSVKNQKGKWQSINSYTGEGMRTDGSFCRKASFADSPVTIALSECVNGNSLMRVDTVNANGASTELHMGFYALPDIGNGIKETVSTLRNGTKAITIDNGQWQVTTVMIEGWDNVSTISCTGLHPEAQKSSVVNLTTTITGQKILKSMLILNKSGERVKIKVADK